jgi:multidrug efflux pump subunit AcrA (membrane-fusion protein)
MSILVFSLSACNAEGRGSPTPTPVPEVIEYERSIFTVEVGPISEEQKLIGSIVPAKQDELFFRTSGYVTRMTVKNGESFKQGDVLAEMQVDDLVNQLEQARIDLEVAQANLTKTKAQNEYELSEAEADVKILDKEVALAELAVAGSSGTAKEKAQLTLDIKNEELALAQKRLALLTNNTNPYMEQAVKRSELAVQRLESLISERQIIAPYDGILLRSTIRSGQQVEAYQAALTIGDPTLQVIQVAFDYDLSTELTEETPVYLLLNPSDETGFPSQYLKYFAPERGVQSVSETVNTDYLYFSLPEEMPADQITTTRNYTLKVVLGSKDAALLLPPAAIRSYKGLNFVIVFDGTTRRRVEIEEIGLRSADRWEVYGDLQEGDQVLGP